MIEEILQLNYRQVLFNRFTSHSESLTRFIDLYLSNLWKAANKGKKEEFSIGELMEAFGKGAKSWVTKKRDMKLALRKLVDKGVVKSVPLFKTKTRMDGSVDYIMILEPTDSFVEDMIRANSKHKGLRSQSEQMVSIS